jgi:hypothetical protein
VADDDRARRVARLNTFIVARFGGLETFFPETL